jgi:hypothetical protein
MTAAAKYGCLPRKQPTKKPQEFKPLSVAKFRVDPDGAEVLEQIAPHGDRLIEGIAASTRMTTNGNVYDIRGGQLRLPVKVLFGHKGDMVGNVVLLRKTARDLFIRCSVNHSMAGDYVWHLIETGEARDFSIGAHTPDPQTTDGKVFISSWTLNEISITRRGASPAARGFRIVKAASIWSRYQSYQAGDVVWGEKNVFKWKAVSGSQGYKPGESPGVWDRYYL